mmetsp:Transcript_51864/g.150947  ORF Transcript_51864/g.150947 Transcript_51864/m.150947 type:complete len:219 (-) Transcript_51864:481-1137(-)
MSVIVARVPFTRSCSMRPAGKTTSSHDSADGSWINWHPSPVRFTLKATVGLPTPPHITIRSPSKAIALWRSPRCKKLLRGMSDEHNFPPVPASHTSTVHLSVTERKSSEWATEAIMSPLGENEAHSRNCSMSPVGTDTLSPVVAFQIAPTRPGLKEMCCKTSPATKFPLGATAITCPLVIFSLVFLDKGSHRNVSLNSPVRTCTITVSVLAKKWAESN